MLLVISNVARYNTEAVAKGIPFQSPSPCCPTFIFFGLGADLIDCDAGAERCSRHLCYWRSGAGVGTGVLRAGTG